MNRGEVASGAEIVAFDEMTAIALPTIGGSGGGGGGAGGAGGSGNMKRQSSVLVIDMDAQSASGETDDKAEARLPSLTPYSFRECWQSNHVPENETKKQFYWRRFCEIVMMLIACCIRCVGPV